MSNVNILYTGNDTLIEVAGLKNEVSGAFLNAATVTCTLVNAAGNQVVGETWPKTLSYVASSDGIYRATLPYSMNLTAGDRYTAQITANGGSGLRGYWELPCVARARS